MPGEPRLKWEGDDCCPQTWAAKAGPLNLFVREPDDDDEGYYWVLSIRGIEEKWGERPDLLSAQLTAEEYASDELREGVEALGGVVLDAADLPLVAEALCSHGANFDSRALKLACVLEGCHPPRGREGE